MTSMQITYGYSPGGLPTVQLTQLLQTVGSTTYTESPISELTSTVTLVDKPSGTITNLVVTFSDKFTVSFGWDALPALITNNGNSPLTSYLVEGNCAGNTTGCTSGWQILSQGSLSTSLSITLTTSLTVGMTYSTYYKIRVTPVNLCGTGYSPTQVTLTTAIPPSAPLTANAPVLVSIAAHLISVSWPAIDTSQASTGGYPVTSYQILWALSPATASSFVLLQDSNTLAYSMTSGWNYSTSYEFKVRAKNSLGLGVLSSSLIVATTKDPALCVLPTGMSNATVVIVNPLSIKISWSQLTDSRNGGDTPLFYSVQWSTNNSTWTVLNAGGALAYSYTHSVTTPFASGSFVYYRVAAQNVVGLGTYSSSLQVTADLIPSGMTGLTISQVDPTSISFSWVELTNVTLNGGDIPIFYSVEWSTNSSTWTVLNSGGPLAYQYSHQVSVPFTSGSTQYYRVRAQNNAGMGTATSYSQVLAVICDSVPSVSPNLIFDQIHPMNVTLNWTALNDSILNGGDTPSFYSLQFKTQDANSSWTEINTGAGSALTYTFIQTTVFDPTLLLYFRLLAQNGVGNATSYSTVLTVSPCTQPIGMNAPTLVWSSTSGQQIKWTNLTNQVTNGGDLPIFYSVEYSCDKVTWYVVNYNDNTTLINNITNYPSTPLTKRSYYRVRAQNNVGMSSVYSSTLSVLIAGTQNYTAGCCGVSPTAINICWSECTDMWGTVPLPTFYQVEWLNPIGHGAGIQCSDVSATLLNDQRLPSVTGGPWKVVSPTTGEKLTSYIHTLPTGLFVGNVFPSGLVQCYRLRYYLNGVPMPSTTSTVVGIQADQVPYGMTPPILVEVHPYNVTVEWAELLTIDNGGDVPSFYMLEWFNYNTNSWKALTTSANGLILKYTHVVTGAVFLNTTTLQYRLTAKNAVGLGTTCSSTLSVTPCTAPIGMDSIFLVSVAPYSITIGWPSLTTTLNGGDQPFYYEVEWLNPVTQIWTSMINNQSIGLQYTYTHIQNTTFFDPGTNMNYRVRPLNLVGYASIPSTVLTVGTDTVPGIMNTPYSVSINPMNITIGWAALVTSVETGGDPISYYSLEWDSGTNGTSWSVINSISNKINTSFTITQPRIFTPKSLITFRARALNTIGYGNYSNNLVITTDGPPTRMNIPTASSITPKQVTMIWTAITSSVDTGGDAIIYYQLNFLVRPCYSTTTDCNAEDIAVGVWTEVTSQAIQGASLTFVDNFSTVLKPNNIFYYQVCPLNGVGYGACSTMFTFLSDNFPQFMYDPVIAQSNITPTWAYITWTPITLDSQTGRDAAIFYDLQCDFGTNQSTWTSIIPSSTGLVTSFNQTTQTIFPNGYIYYYKLRAQNNVGFGVFSNIVKVILNSNPISMTTPAVSTINITPYLITAYWSSLTDTIQNGNDLPIYYELSWLRQSSSTWVVSTTQSMGAILTNTVTTATPFLSGEVIQFKLRAMNHLGFGPFSSILSITGDTIPLYMNTPVISQANINPTWIGVTWSGISSPAQTGGDFPIYYELSWDQGALGTWQILTSQSQGLAYSYTVTTTIPFLSSQIINFRLRAVNNVVGFGAYSSIVLINCDSVPLFMNTPAVTSANINPNWIYLTWSGISGSSQTGGDSPVYYGLQWDQGTANWINLTTSGLNYQFNVTSLLPFGSGITLQFRAFAVNGVAGIGAFSTVLDVVTDKVPQFMNTPVVNYTANNVNPTWIYLTWSGISDIASTGGDTVIYYELQWDQGNGSWTPVTTYLLGAAINYAYNLTSPTPFQNGSPQSFRLRAQNGVGLGIFSSTLIVTADSVPLQMVPPNVDLTANHVNPTWVYLTWSDIVGDSQTGGDNAIYYGLEWDQGNSTWKNLTSKLMGKIYNFNMTTTLPLASGLIMQFRTYAQNGVGYGSYSTTLEVKADMVPQFMNTPFVNTTINNVNPQWIYITWSTITGDAQNGGDIASYYGIQWDQGNNQWANLTTPSLGLITAFNLTSIIPFASGLIIQLRTYAGNGVGQGVYSNPLSVQCDQVPQFMNIPSVNFALNQINPNWIFVTWTGITGDNQTGGDVAVFYGLEWDQGNSTWNNLTTYSMGLMYQFNMTSIVPYSSGIQIQFRAYAKNGVGFGVYSNVLSITSDKVPQYMNQPSVNFAMNQINPKWIFVTWTGITGDSQTGGDVAVYYGLEWDQGNNTWSNLTTYSMGIMYQFNMTSIVPYTSGILIQFRTFAKNGVGYGAYSNVLQIISDKVPQYMNEPQVNYAANDINPKWIYITWSGISGDNETGGDVAVFYGLEWDQGNSTWTNLTTYSMGIIYQFNMTSPTLPYASGMEIQFRSYAKNGVGYGEYSNVLSIISDKVPQYMNDPQVNYAANDINPNWIYITWSGISGDLQTGGDIAVYYGLEWDQASQNWTNLTTQSIGMITQYNLTSPTTPFASNCTIQLRAYAENGVGFGLYSFITVIQADSVPLYMNMPQVDYYANDINPTWIEITWTGISGDLQTGGDIASYYGLDTDNGNGTWTRLTQVSMGLIYTFNHTSTVPFASGLTISYRLIARNGVGYGAYSDLKVINADTVPLRMNAPTEVQTDYNQIQITWDPIFDWADTGGDNINYYEVQFLNKNCYQNDQDDCSAQSGTWISLSNQISQGINTNFNHTQTAHFSQNRNFEYRICAQNGVGMGACSPSLTVLTDTYPQQMDPISVVQIYFDEVILQWMVVTDFEKTGRSSVISYQIQWDNYQYYSPGFYPNNTDKVQWKNIGIVIDDNQSIALSFTHQMLPNFISKQKIMYRIIAINNVGPGQLYSVPTQVITQDRYWSKAHSWSPNQVPILGSSFVIPFGQNWTYDLLSSPVYGQIQIGGRLQFNEEAPILHLSANQIIITTGQLIVGQVNQPFQGQATITLSGVKSSQNYSFSTSIIGGNKILANFGSLQLFGVGKQQFSYMQQSSQKGDLSVKLDSNLTWTAGDKIGFSPSNMRYNQSDYAVIVSYDISKGLAIIDRPLSYYHYGSINSTSPQYSGIEMRNKVYLLSRNILIEGDNVDNWGCQILTSNLVQGVGLVRIGVTQIDNIEVSNCSQYGTRNAAFRFEGSSGQQRITNTSIHHGLGQAVQIATSQNILMQNNTIFDFGKYGINVSTSQNVILDGNHISVIRDKQFGELPTSQIQPSGIVGCINSDCSLLSIINNVVSGVSYAGFIASGHECGVSASQQIFKNNIAHSINGYGAVIFSNQMSLSQTTYCVQASYFSAYKCSNGGVVIYNATLGATFSNMILIDNHIGGTIMMIGDESNENNTQLAIFQDSIFYGETDSHDCDSSNICANGQGDSSQCFDKTGLMVSYFSKQGKMPMVASALDLPYEQIESDASYGGDSVYRNITFSNYQSPNTWCGLTQKAIGLNPYGADYHPRSQFNGITFQNVSTDAIINLFTPPMGWVETRRCGNIACTGPLNTFLSFTGTKYSGIVQPADAKANFQVAPYTTQNVGKMPNCTFVKAWNAYNCQNPNLAILLFESRDDDKLTKLVSPIIVSNNIYSTNAEINSFMSHQVNIATGVERLSRWPVLIQTGHNLVYDVNYAQNPPQRQRFTLVANIGSVTINIKYPPGGAYILRDRQNNQIPANPRDDTTMMQTPITGKNCGENRYDSVASMLEFYLTPNCSVWIEGVDLIQSNLRLNWTLKGFKENGGVNTFVTMLSQSLGIKQSYINVQSVVQGSVIVNFQIVQTQDDPVFEAAGGIKAIKSSLNQKIQTQSLWVGAPILNATVTGNQVNINSIKTNFSKPDGWNATGKEVWVIPASAASVLNSTNGLNVVSQTVVQPDSSSKNLSIIIGVILAVGIFTFGLAFLIYRRYKRAQDNEGIDRINSVKAEQDPKAANLKIYGNDLVTGGSPLKGEFSIYDEEALDDQYHPSKAFSMRKLMENGDLKKKVIPEEARTGDNFYDHGLQPTFGEGGPEGDSEQQLSRDYEEEEVGNVFDDEAQDEKEEEQEEGQEEAKSSISEDGQRDDQEVGVFQEEHVYNEPEPLDENFQAEESAENDEMEMSLEYEYPLQNDEGMKDGEFDSFDNLNNSQID